MRLRLLERAHGELPLPATGAGADGRTVLDHVQIARMGPRDLGTQPKGKTKRAQTHKTVPTLGQRGGTLGFSGI